MVEGINKTINNLQSAPKNWYQVQASDAAGTLSNIWPTRISVIRYNYNITKEPRQETSFW